MSACASLLLCAACAEPATDAYGPPVAELQSSPGQADALRERASAYFAPVGVVEPPSAGREAALFALGRALFFDARLSVDGQVACASCHQVERAGADGLATSVGVLGRRAVRNAPSVFNAALHRALQWRADAESLADQAARSLLDPVLFGNADEGALQGRLRDAGYADALRALFLDAGEPVSLGHVAEAIAQFERTLITPGAFDAFLMGDSTALNLRAQRGLDLFMSLGCADCHSGPGIGGQQLAKLGVVEAYATPSGSETGRFEITHVEDDRAVFKVPSLRNVAQTAPYFHDGSVIGIEQAVRDMARLQLGRQLGQSEVRALSDFLGALSGAAPAWFAPADE